MARLVSNALCLMWALRRADLLYLISGMLSRRVKILYWVTRLLGVPVLVHWIGGDVRSATKHFEKHTHAPRAVKRHIHWAAAPWLVEELRGIGIEAAFVPFTSRKKAEFLSLDPPRLPNRFTILSYLPDHRAEFYGWDKVVRLAHDFPQAQIVIVRGEGAFVDECPPNVHFLGWVDDIYDVYRDCTVVVRMTEHDGYSHIVQEALLLGRYVIWTYPFPGALQAKDYPSLRDHIDDLIARQDQGVLEVNGEGRAFIERNLNPDTLSKQLRDRLRECATQGRR
ncbi:hypothetical protein ACFLS0_05415 [Candidatus Bipolaricaulota bacterium]